jgi:hypothetical protein
MSSTSTWPEKIQLVFEPSLPGAKPISVSNDLSTSSESSKKVLSNTFVLTDIKMIGDLTNPSCSDTSFFRNLASAKNPDRATSRFIARAIENDDGTCLWLNAKFSLVGHTLPKGLSIHLFTNATAKKVSSHEVRSMIIQVSEPCDSYPNISKFLEFLFSKVSFTKLKCLMFYGFQLLEKFSDWMEELDLETFHMAKFPENIPFHPLNLHRSSRWWKNLEALYVVYPNDRRAVMPPKELKRLVIHCPESSESVINDTKIRLDELKIYANPCQALEEM